MMETLAAIGLVLIVKYSFILKVPREYFKDKSFIMKEFLSCAMCMGFWAGLLIHFFIGLLLNISLTPIFISFCLLKGFSTSLLAYIVDLVLEYFDEKIYSLRTKNDQINKDNGEQTDNGSD